MLSVGLILIAATSSAIAQQLSPETARSIGACADPSKLEKLCVDVLEKRSAPDASPYQYYYEMRIHEAACADPEKDSEEVVARKIRHMWSSLRSHLRCNTTDFEIPRGSVLKYAIRMKAFDLITQAAGAWRVELNWVDDSDGRTLLDYVEVEIARNAGNNVEPILKNYYRILRNAGARHRIELGTAK